MKLQHGRFPTATAALCAGIFFIAGCVSPSSSKWATFSEGSLPDPQSNLHRLESHHYIVQTSIRDSHRKTELMSTLESSFSAYCDVLNYTPPEDAPKMTGYVFATGEEWARFTVKQTGDMASIYLQTRRGGYTVGKLFASRDAGEQDTLTVAAHEGLHLFIATHFVARPPPFVEEGLACCFESIRREESRITINVGENPARQRRLALAVAEKQLAPLAKLLSMHAGQVVGLNVLEVETFYAQSWSFARFLMDGEHGKYRPALDRLLADAQAGRLSSDDLSSNPALIERYLGVQLDTIQHEYDRFVTSLAKEARVDRSE